VLPWVCKNDGAAGQVALRRCCKQTLALPGVWLGFTRLLLLLLLLLLHQAAAHKGLMVSQAAARWLAGGEVLISEREGENLGLLLKKLGLFNNYWYLC